MLELITSNVRGVNMDPKRGYHHGDLRRQLLDGAVAFCAEHGPAAFSLSALARALGVSSAAPYRHFADKDALFAAVAEEGYQRLGELLAAARREAPVESVVEMGHAYLRFAGSDRGHFAVMFGGGVDKDRFPVVRVAGDAALAALVGEVTRAGGQAADALTVWALAHGFATLEREGLWGETPGAPGLHDAAEAAVRTLLAGM